MFNIEKSEKTIFDELITRSLSIAAVQEVGDSSIKRIMHRSYDVAESEIRPFVNNRGVMADGLKVTIDSVDEDSYNILTNIILESVQHGEVSRSSVRFGNNLDSVFVFVNGLKVPDSSIWFYSTNSNTNVFIPKKFFNKDSINEIVFEERKFNAFTYGGSRFRDVVNKNFVTFQVSPHRNLTVSKDTCMLFCDGVYIQDKIARVDYVNDMVDIKLSVPITGDVEVFVDSAIAYRRTRTVAASSVIPFYIDDNFVDPLYGPINNDNCIFFLNGRRISNHNIEQVGRLNFHYNAGSVIQTSVATTIFTDYGIVKTENDKLYADDYFLYNFIGSAKITTALMRQQQNLLPNVNEEFDKFVNYKELLGTNYTYSKVIETIKELDLIDDITLKILTLLQKFPALVKDFLENFSNDSIKKNYVWDGVKNPIVIGTDRKYTPGTRVIKVVSVNGKIAKIEKIIVRGGENYWQTSIDSKWFVVGSNDVEIIESAQTGDPSSYKVVPIDRYETTFDPYRYRAVQDCFGNVNSIDDFKVLIITKREFDPNGIYFKGSDYGFRIVSGAEVPRMVYDDKIYLDFGVTDPRIDMLIIISVKHHEVFGFHVEEFDTTYESLFNELYVGVEKFFDDNVYHDVKIPLIHTGSVIVCDTEEGVRLFKGIDYLFRSSNEVPNLRKTGILFKRKLPSGFVSIAVLPDYTQNNEYPSLSTEDTGSNKYGLLYLGNLKMPYSPKYVNVYANNKSMLEKDIDILSNKLIRLHSEVVSLQNVYVEVNFKTSFTLLRPFIQIYSDSSFERKIQEIFSCYNFFAPSNSISYPRSKVDGIYETFDSGVDSNAKTPNPVRTSEYITPRYNLFIDAYLRWFISDRSKHKWTGNLNIPSKVLEELEIFKENCIHYAVWAFDKTYAIGSVIVLNDRMIYRAKSSNGNKYPKDFPDIWEYIGYDNSHDVVVLGYKETLISDIVLKTTEVQYPGFTTEGTVKNFLDCCVENGISIQECFCDYDNYYHSNRVFKHDLLPISALQTFDGEDIVIGRGPTRLIGG